MRYIIIVGGQLQNKGAQAMTFTVVDEMKKKYPDKEVVLFSAVYTERDKLEAKNFQFKVLPWPIRVKMKILGYKAAILTGSINYLKYLIKGSGVQKSDILEIEQILNNADFMIDVSGYALSSQRGFQASLSYIYNIMIAEKYNIPVVLFPQSFGPFNYTNKERKIIMPLIEEYLQYPNVVFAREKEGVEYLKEFNLNNVKHSYDIVLQGKNDFELSNIFKSHAINKQKLETYIGPNSVAIVPNEKIMQHGREQELYDIYKLMINKLLENDKKVYLIRHSFEDLAICKKIKSKFSDNENVILLEDDYNCILIDDLLSHFEFIIASRYHSIIHAYKNDIPAMVFGWAIKYQELLHYFNQNKYMFDVRETLNTDDILKSLTIMLENHKKESLIINKQSKEIRKTNIFDYIN